MKHLSFPKFNYNWLMQELCKLKLFDIKCHFALPMVLNSLTYKLNVKETAT